MPLNNPPVLGTVADGSITAAKLAADAVETAKIKDLNVTAAKLAADSVTTAKILDLNVTAGKLAADSVTTAKILDGNVTEAKLATSIVSGWVKVSETIVTGSAIGQVDFATLTGDTAIEYMILAMVKTDHSGAATTYKLGFNDDAAANYSRQQTQTNLTTLTAGSYNGSGPVNLFIGATAVSQYAFAQILIYAKSGTPRFFILNGAGQIVPDNNLYNLTHMAGTWSNTADQITKINFIADQTDGIGIGSRIILYKRGA